MQTNDTPNIVGFYTQRQVCQLTSLSPATLWRMRRAGSFPNAVSISRGRVAYSREAVHSWIEDRLEGDPQSAKREA